ncbi:hypothetical protein GGR57DRAFT_83822 [Xylariaceae sp. FL1272]|nr:hypothetical protein GGR57DRAFT_83822 [Xylariaceae sp. FL1272]
MMPMRRFAYVIRPPASVEMELSEASRTSSKLDDSGVVLTRQTLGKSNIRMPLLHQPANGDGKCLPGWLLSTTSSPGAVLVLFRVENLIYGDRRGHYVVRVWDSTAYRSNYLLQEDGRTTKRVIIHMKAVERYECVGVVMVTHILSFGRVISPRTAAVSRLLTLLHHLNRDRRIHWPSRNCTYQQSQSWLESCSRKTRPRIFPVPRVYLTILLLLISNLVCSMPLAES